MNSRAMTFFRSCALFSLLALAFVSAQDLSADAILENLRESAESLQDARFVLTGSLTDPGGQVLPLEVNVQTIPNARVARADILQPDALADNAVILSGDVVYNYVFLTNQATIFPSDDPDALGGLFPEGNTQQGFDMTFNPEQLFRGWEAEVLGYRETPLGNAYDLRFVNLEPDAVVSYVLATILEDGWVPYTLEFYDAAGTQLTRLVIENFERDLGLDPAAITYLPPDAELIDER
jgi:outer membrane lipoprotein-sorting protein